MENTRKQKAYVPAILISSALVAMIASNAMAFSGDTKKQDPEFAAKKAAVKEAITSGDYATFSELTADKDHFAYINASNFLEFGQAVALKKAGDHEGAKAIMESLGIEPPHKRMRGMHGERNKEGNEKRSERHEAVHTAIKSGDFNAFSEASPKFAENITEANFKSLQEAHALREAGDHEEAKAIIESLGIEPPHKGIRGGMKGMRGEKPQQ